MTGQSYICDECDKDLTDEAEGDYDNGRWVQLPSRCPCGGRPSWQEREVAK